MGYEMQQYGMEVLSAGAGLANRDPHDVVSTDIKSYEQNGFKFAVAQAEVTDLVQLAEHREKLQKALNELTKGRGLDFSILLVTDVVRGSSRVFISEPTPPIMAELPFPPLADGTRDAPGVVSRKKQLLPAILGLIE